jgi:hypothetical protein
MPELELISSIRFGYRREEGVALKKSFEGVFSWHPAALKSLSWRVGLSSKRAKSLWPGAGDGTVNAVARWTEGAGSFSDALLILQPPPRCSTASAFSTA